MQACPLSVARDVSTSKRKRAQPHDALNWIDCEQAGTAWRKSASGKTSLRGEGVSWALKKDSSKLLT